MATKRNPLLARLTHVDSFHGENKPYFCIEIKDEEFGWCVSTAYPDMGVENHEIEEKINEMKEEGYFFFL